MRENWFWFGFPILVLISIIIGLIVTVVGSLMDFNNKVVEAQETPESQQIVPIKIYKHFDTHSNTLDGTIWYFTDNKEEVECWIYEEASGYTGVGGISCLEIE